MTATFQAYAAYYDALYEAKDYERECDVVERLFRADAIAPVRSVLDLGCGTGGHALPLASRGYEVVGVDRSAEMLDTARRKNTRVSGTPAAVFQQGDATSVRLGRTFDAVISMFAVVSYQTTNIALTEMFSTARAHLEQGRLFIFDAWFGPGVLADPPTARERLVQLDGEQVLRKATPALDLLAQTVRVHYELRRAGGDIRDADVEETHEMRFLFPQEVRLLLEQTGFDMLRIFPFLEPERALTMRDWNFMAVARAQ